MICNHTKFYKFDCTTMQNNAAKWDL